MAKRRQRTGFGPGVYRGKPLTADKLRQYAEGTNKAIAAGIPIPLLKKHAPIGADDETTKAAAELEGLGWLEGVEQEEDGSLAWLLNVTDEAADAAIDAGTLKFTSPEFRESYTSEKAGVYEGPIVRHVAFTPLPGNPHQGNIETIALSEAEGLFPGCFQFSEGDREELEDEQFVEGHAGYVAAAKKLAAKRNLSARAKEASEAAHALSSKASDAYSHRMAGDAFHDAARMHHNEGNSDLGEAYSAAAKSHFAQAKLSQHAEMQPGDIVHHSKNPSKFGKIHSVKDGQYRVHWENGEKLDHGDTEIVKVPKSAMQHGEMPSGLVDDKSYKAKGEKHPTEETHEDDPSKTTAPKDISEEESPPQDDEEDNEVLKKRKKKAEQDANLQNGAEEESQHAEENVDGLGKPANDEPPPPEAPPEREVNPDMPPRATDKTKCAAVLAGLNKKGVVLPSDFDFTDEAALDILLAALNSSIKAEQEAEAKNKEPEEESPPPKEAAMPFVERASQHGEKPDAAGQSSDFTKDISHGMHPAYKDRMHVLDTHGYVPVVGTKMRKLEHPEGHAVHLYSGGEWSHSTKGGKVVEGMGSDSLRKHLRSVHGSQHGENAMPFSEQELAQIPESLRARFVEEQSARKAAEDKAVEAEAKAQQFAEREATAKNEAAKAEALRKISEAPIPPALRKTLLATYDAVQFSEGEEQPTYTAVQVAELVGKTIPTSLQFLEELTVSGKLKQAANPKDGNGKPINQFFEADGDIPAGHISAERAEELVAASPIVGKRYTPGNAPAKTLSDVVRDDAGKHPLGWNNRLPSS